MNIVELIDQQLEYYNQHDLEGFCSTYHTDVEIYNLTDNSLILKGMEALKSRYKERFQASDLHAVITNRIVIGNKVIDHEEVTGILKDQIVKAVAIYEVDGSLIKKVSFISE